MEDSNKIDRLFNERLSEGESLSPADAWGAIRGKMTQKEAKQKRVFPIPFLWLSAAFVSGLLIGGLGFYAYLLKNENLDLKQQLVQVQDAKVLVKKTPVIQNVVGENSNNGRNSNNGKNDVSKNSISRSVAHRPKFKTPPNVFVGVFTNKNISSKSLFATNHEGFINETEKQIAVGENSNSNRATSINANNNSSNTLSNQTETNLLASNQPKTLDSLKQEPVDSSKKMVAEKDETIKKKKAPKIFGLPIAVGFYLSPEMASRSVNFSTNSSDDVKTYKQNDKNKFGFGAGFNLELELPRNYFFRTGISYWNVGERNTSEYQVAKSDTTYSPNNVYIRTTNISTGPGSTTTIVAFDTTKVNSGGTSFTGQKITLAPSREIKESFNHFSSTIQNNYHYIGIPVVIGLRLGQSRFRAGMYSGLIANVLVSSNRAVYSIYYDPRSPEKYVQATRQLSRFSVVYWGGVDFDYQLAPNWSVTLSPNIKYSMTSLYQNEPEVRQLSYSFGVLFGCRYSFGK